MLVWEGFDDGVGGGEGLLFVRGAETGETSELRFGVSILRVGHAGTRVDRDVRAIEMKSQGQGMLVVAMGVASGRRVA